MYQVLVHSFARNQLERRSVSIFAQIFYLLIVMTHLCSVGPNNYMYACKFVIGLSIYIISRKVRKVPSLSYQRRLTKGVGSYIFSQHMDIGLLFTFQYAY